MLKHLYIKNYALIEELDIEFHAGFLVITGETGAGKSILLGALNLLLGQRADAKSIRTGAKKCVIEAVFTNLGQEIQETLDQNDLDTDGTECIIRREISANGKSRAFVNDTPVTLNLLKELGQHLVDIHSQHENLLVNNEYFQLHVLDILAQNKELLSEYQSVLKEYKANKALLQTALEDLQKAKAEQDYYAFQLEQIDALNLEAGEDHDLEKEQNELTHAEEIKSALYQVSSLLNDENGGVLPELRSIRQRLSSLEKIFPAVEPYNSRIDSTFIELTDIESDLSGYMERVEYNPQRLAEVEERLNAIYSIEKKHSLNSAEEILSFAEALRQKLGSIEDKEERIEELREKGSALLARMKQQAAVLSANRKKAQKGLESTMKERLSGMEMPHNKFEVSLTPLETMNAYGADAANFLFSANKNVPPRPISEVASGGEISRVMLALKTIMGKEQGIPTIIFDEIDTGVSGKVADSMALMMDQMVKDSDLQVLAITHLPQIAVYGSSHYYVYKKDTEESTVSYIKELDAEGRVMEIAHMLSGNVVTKAALENAKQLLKK